MSDIKKDSTGETGHHMAAEAAPKKEKPSLFTVEISTRPKSEIVTRRAITKRTWLLLLMSALLVAIVVAAVYFVSRREQSKYDDYYLSAMEAYYGGDYETALADLRKAIAIDPTEECTRMILDCYDAQENYEKCIEILRTMDTTDPQVQQSIAAYTELLKQQGEKDLITVLGTKYDSATSSLVLQDKNLGNDALQEIIRLYALTNLCLSGNQISDISALSVLGGLTMLDLSDNEIADVSALSGLTALRTLYLDNNPIQDFSGLYALSGLTTLSIKGIEISDVQLDELSAALPNCAIHSETATKSTNDISLGGTTFKSDVTTLKLSGLGISDISALTECKNLKELDISGNSISDLSPLLDLPCLTTLNISDNEVTDIRPLMGIVKLKELQADNNQIHTTVPLKYVSGLTSLSLAGNPIENFSGLGGCTGLTTLNVRSTGLTDEALASFSTLTKLTELNIEDNPDISGETVDTLQEQLKCRIIHSDLVYLVELGGEKIREDVTEIVLNDREISDITEISRFKNLERLEMKNNRISEVYYIQYLKNLKVVNLSNNQIWDVAPFTEMYSLEELDLSNNKVTSVYPFLYLTNLKKLNLTGNQISEADLKMLRNALPDCEILCDVVSQDPIAEAADLTEIIKTIIG